MDIDRLKFDNKQELRQVAEYGYVVVGDSAKRASEIEWLLAERDRLAAERDELQRRLVEVVAALKPAQIKWSKASMDSPEYHAWCLVVPLYAQAVAIAEGRNNG